MKNDAIVTDVSAEKKTAGEIDDAGEAVESGDVPAKKSEPLPRDKALSEIARQYEKSIGIEREEEDEQDEDLDLDAGDDQDDDAKLEDKTTELDPDDPLAALGYYKNAKGEVVTKIKVNGEEREITADQLKSFIQKDLAGDRKLQEAYDKEQKLTQRERQLAEQENKLRTTMTAQKKPSEQDAAKLRESIKAAFDKVYDGDLDSATEALMTVMMERGNTTLSPEDSQQQVEQVVLSAIKKQEQARQLQDWNKSVDDGNRELAKNHPEIYKDPNLFNLVNSKTAELLELRDKGDPDYSNLTPKEIIAKAADEVNQWLGNKRGGKEADKGNSRESRKAGLKPVVRGMDSVTRKAPKQELDMSPSAVVKRMAQSRASSINRGA